MQRFAMMLAAIAGLALPVAASAQSPAQSSAQPANRSDLAYCRTLSDLYLRYIGRDETSPHGWRTSSSAEGNLAVAQCRQGNAAASIPVLERKLSNARFTLPPRG